MTIHRKIDGARHIHLHSRLHRGKLLPVQDLRRNPEPMGLLGCMSLLIQSTLRLAEHQQAFAGQPEIIPRSFSQLLVAGAAGHVQIAQERRASRDMIGRRRFAKLQSPIEQVAIEARTDVERASRIEHHPHGHPHHSRRRQRNEMARHHHPGIAE